MLNISELEKKTITELHNLAKELDISGYTTMRKKDLIFAILKNETEEGGNIFAEGVLDIIPNEGYGFLRPSKYVPSSDDIYISASQIRRFDLRSGDVVSGQVREPKENEKYFALLRIEAVNYQDPEKATQRAYFEDLTPPPRGWQQRSAGTRPPAAGKDRGAPSRPAERR